MNSFMQHLDVVLAGLYGAFTIMGLLINGYYVFFKKQATPTTSNLAMTWKMYTKTFPIMLAGIAFNGILLQVFIWVGLPLLAGVYAFAWVGSFIISPAAVKLEKEVSL